MDPTGGDAGGRSPTDVIGCSTFDAHGNHLGTINGTYGDADGRVRYVALTTPWSGTARLVVPFEGVDVDIDAQRITLPYDGDELRAAPMYTDREYLNTGDESAINDHFARAGHWETVNAMQTTPAPTLEVAEADVATAHERGESPLRSDLPSDGRRDDPLATEPGDDPNPTIPRRRRWSWRGRSR